MGKCAAARLVAQDQKIRAILQILAPGPKLATDLPRYASELLIAKQQGLCAATCVHRTTSSNAGEHSKWLWRITPAGKRWLADHPSRAPVMHQSAAPS